MLILLPTIKTAEAATKGSFDGNKISIYGGGGSETHYEFSFSNLPIITYRNEFYTPADTLSTDDRIRIMEKILARENESYNVVLYKILPHVNPGVLTMLLIMKFETNQTTQKGMREKTETSIKLVSESNKGGRSEVRLTIPMSESDYRKIFDSIQSADQVQKIDGM